MESAIDTHLKCPRTLSRRVADDYAPPFPMFVGRGPQDLQQVVMASFGVQYADEDRRPQALAALRHIVGTFALADGPAHHDLTHHLDNQGHHNLMVLAYWADPAAYCRWLRSDEVAGWWASDERLTEGLGYFREIVAPRVEQLETLYAFTEDFPGVGTLMPQASGEIEEHGYWGSARDRMPISQTDWMEASGELTVVEGDPAQGGRVVVRGHDNICLIRSGQDWRAAGPDERDLYVDEILPTLQDGMDFLRDNGQDHGCYSNRFVRSIDLDGNELDESYNLGHWRSLDLLERWAESHPTHLRIFVTFFRVVTGLEKLRLYHEVSVSDGRDQTFEYINCHPATGMLRDARVPVAG
ncbi:phenylacetaldoxime dehydratase family protein [Pimelobacter simplex]|uniref:Phenylacetaldoxime dehydratase family protein n=2 Tax=Nocardioides simplex TaxID=2045 RepID=A0A7J5E2U3_NOCSI|nr:phenylacetaldoxime dehydratase family protein [Pimelobacter simplex]KAB2812503.1 phenylacetaldoxime dehydratase family protein [Pimelobacter simplex]